MDLLPFTETHLWLEVDHYAASFRIRSFCEKDERKEEKREIANFPFNSNNGL